MGESVIRMKPIAHENEKIRAKTGEQKMFSPRNGCENVKKKEEMGERDLDKGTFCPLYIEDNIGVEMVIRVKAFFHEKPPKERRKNERK